MIAHGALGALEVIVIGCAVACVALCVLGIFVWDREPWWRKFPSPRRQVDDDRDHLRAWRVRHWHPQAFEDYPLPPPPKAGTAGDG